MSRQRQEAGTGSINLQGGRDLWVNLVAAPAEDDEPDVLVRVHIAFLTSDPREPVCWFVNVVNRSRVHDTTGTRVWFETVPRTHVLTLKPGRVAPSSQWETWIEAHELPFSLTKYEWLARVQLADDRVIESVPRENVPEVGFVPGEAIITCSSSRTALSGIHVSSTPETSTGHGSDRRRLSTGTGFWSRSAPAGRSASRVGTIQRSVQG